MSAPPPSFHIPRNQGEAHWLVGDLVTLKLTCEQTGGQCTVAMLGASPGGGPPPHVHHREDEMFYVLEGAYDIIFRDTICRAEIGDLVLLPRDNTHTFKNVSDQHGRMLLVALHSGFDTFVRQAGEPCVDPTKPPAVGDAEIARLMQACALCGIEMQFGHQANARVSAPAARASQRAFGLQIKPLLATTERLVSAFHLTIPPGAGLPAHVNEAGSDLIFVIDGTCAFSLNGDSFSATAGDVIYIAAGATHRFTSAGPEPAQLLSVHMGSDLAPFLAAASGLYPDSLNLMDRCRTPADADALRSLFTRHGMRLAD